MQCRAVSACSCSRKRRGSLDRRQQTRREEATFAPSKALRSSPIHGNRPACVFLIAPLTITVISPRSRHRNRVSCCGDDQRNRHGAYTPVHFNFNTTAIAPDYRRRSPVPAQATERGGGGGGNLPLGHPTPPRLPLRSTGGRIPLESPALSANRCHVTRKLSFLDCRVMRPDDSAGHDEASGFIVPSY